MPTQWWMYGPSTILASSRLMFSTSLEHRKAVISPAVLQRLREANGYTQQAFSRAVRTSRSHYSQSETGEKHLDWNETLWKSG